LPREVLVKKEMLIHLRLPPVSRTVINKEAGV